MADPREISEGSWPDRPPRYPTADKTDAVLPRQARTFDPAAAPRDGERNDGCPASMTDGRMGPGGDPAEGKRSD
jgi:hypothetical protein